MHLAGPTLGGLRFDYRRPKHPYSDKFMLAGGHCIPTCYALWMVMGQALERRYQATGNQRYYVDPAVAILPIDALGFRRGAGALEDAAPGSGARRHAALRAGQGARHQGPRRTCRERRRHQRCQRRSLGHWHRHRRRQGRVLGHRRRVDGRAEDHRVRRRVRDDRRSRAGAEDAGPGAADRQASAGDDFRQQRRH